MPNGYAPNDVTLQPSQVIGASVTNLPITKPYSITAGGSTHHVVVIDATGVTSTTGLTAKLQTAVNGTYTDSKTVAITAAGRFFIKLSIEVSGDQTYLPLLSQGRVVITTGTGDAATITAVTVLQDL